jgi:hypothetical protein
MEFRNGILLQLFECIESTQNEVKRKMIETGASNDAQSHSAMFPRKKSLRDENSTPVSRFTSTSTGSPSSVVGSRTGSNRCDHTPSVANSVCLPQLTPSPPSCRKGLTKPEIDKRMGISI